MIIQGQSPTTRHVSRTHRVALDWLFERINLDHIIQVRYIDTKHQLADIFFQRKFHTWSFQPFQLTLLLSEFQLDQLNSNDGEKDARTGRRREDRGKDEADDDEAGLHCSLTAVCGCVCDQPRINPRHFGDSYFKWLRGWSLIRQKLLDWQRLIGSSLCAERRVCWLTELFSLQLPKPTSFSDSVQCLRGISTEPVKAWESKIKWFLETRYL